MSIVGVLAALVVIGVPAAAWPQSLWTDASRAAPESLDLRNPPSRYRTVTLDVRALGAVLEPPATAARADTALEIELPLPDGGSERFAVVPTRSMEDGLAAKFPDLRSYTGASLEDPTTTASFLWSPRGIDAIVIGPAGTSFVEPARHDGTAEHIVHHSRDAAPHVWSEPDVSHEIEHRQAGAPVIGSRATTSGSQLREYRLAVAVTGEFTQTHGGSVSSALAAVVARVVALNAIYEREFAIRFVLVADNDKIIYRSPLTDPYVDLASGGPPTQLTINQNAIDGRIGSDNYDIGHLLLQNQTGGVACCPPCGPEKAKGQSGSGGSLEVLAQEIGHQFKASHTWSSLDCAGGDPNNPNDQYKASAAYEPGGGTTLMAYPRACSKDSFADRIFQFHSHSFDQIRQFVTGAGSTCGTSEDTSNAAPVVTAGRKSASGACSTSGAACDASTPCPMGQTCAGAFPKCSTSGVACDDATPCPAGQTCVVAVLPTDTPFVLSGSATDATAVQYAWEGYDLAPDGKPAPPNNGKAPYFRVFPATSSPARTFPQLSDVVDNVTSLGEELPPANDVLSFRLHVWDGLGGVAYDATQIGFVTPTSPFKVTSPDTGNPLWEIGSTQMVTWSHSGTTAAPFSCAKVSIDLSIDGGFTYPIALASETMNDGSATVAVPDAPTSTARVRVRCTTHPDHFFFDISDRDFRVWPSGLPTCSTTTTTVRRPEDSGPCTLRDTVAAAPRGATITFDPAIAGLAIVLASEITIGKSLTIQGPPAAVTISGDRRTRVFRVTEGSVTMHNLAIVDGNAGASDGGGLRVDRGAAVTLRRSTVAGCRAANGAGISNAGAVQLLDSTLRANQASMDAGGIDNPNGVLLISGSTIHDNFADDDSGGIQNIGADSTLRMSNSTVSFNRSHDWGGGIRNEFGGKATLTNVTVFGNECRQGGAGVHTFGSGATLTIGNTILAENFSDRSWFGGAPADCSVGGDGKVTDRGNNLVQRDDTCDLTAKTSSVFDASNFAGQAILGPLRANGGPTLTHELRPTSAGRHQGKPELCQSAEVGGKDQRGFSRNPDLCDVGAVETGVDGRTVGTAGGTVTAANGTVIVTIPAGALSGDTEISVEETFNSYCSGSRPRGDDYGTYCRISPDVNIVMQPTGTHFTQPVRVTFRWDDRDDDGLIDRGVCVAGASANLSCDQDADCPPSATALGRCSAGTPRFREDRLTLFRDWKLFNAIGHEDQQANPYFDVWPCEQNASGACETAAADCGDPAGTGKATIAMCCDRERNEWTFETCDFSHFGMGANFTRLIPGRGSARTDCYMEWKVNNPKNVPYVDKKGLLSSKQVCTDGDLLCDADGTANGACVFEIGACLNLPDDRLVSRSGAPLCTPSEIETWEIRKPRPTDRDPTMAANAVILRDAVAAIGAGTVSGRQAQRVTFAPPVSTEDVCSRVVEVTVPLARPGRKGRLRIKATASTPDRRDTDRITLTCLPEGG